LAHEQADFEYHVVSRGRMRCSAGRNGVVRQHDKHAEVRNVDFVEQRTEGGSGRPEYPLGPHPSVNRIVIQTLLERASHL